MNGHTKPWTLWDNLLVHNNYNYELSNDNIGNIMQFNWLSHNNNNDNNNDID